VGYNFLLKYLLERICKKLEPVSIIKIRKITTKGIKIPTLILRMYNNEAKIPHKQNAPASPINTLAGLMLKNKNAIKHAIRIPIIVVAKYVPLKNVTIAKTKKIILISHPAKPSNPSVILIALTILMVKKKVIMGKKIPR
jgi:hypothetical protein